MCLVTQCVSDNDDGDDDNRIFFVNLVCYFI